MSQWRERLQAQQELLVRYELVASAPIAKAMWWRMFLRAKSKKNAAVPFNGSTSDEVFEVELPPPRSETCMAEQLPSHGYWMVELPGSPERQGD